MSADPQRGRSVIWKGVEVDPLQDDCIGLPPIRHGDGQIDMAAPLRKIIESTEDEDILECGHRLASSRDIYGNTYPERRRCVYCAQESRQTPITPIPSSAGEAT